MDLRTLRGSVALRLQPKSPVQILDDDRRDDRDEEQRKPETEEESNEGERERVEGQVEPELRVVYPE